MTGHGAQRHERPSLKISTDLTPESGAQEGTRRRNWGGGRDASAPMTGQGAQRHERPSFKISTDLTPESLVYTIFSQLPNK